MTAFVLAALASLGIGGSWLLGAPQKPSEASATSYQLPFGADPFLPSQATFKLPGFLRASDVPRAVYCGQCHKEAYRQWRESAHANSFREPFYTRNVNLLIAQKGIAYSRHCEGCHNPVALLSGSLTANSQADRSFDEEGITCMTCHAISRVKDASGTGSYEMGVPAVLIRDDGTSITGEVSPAEVMKNLPQHRRAMVKDFYRSAEFCSVCHKASIPRSLNGYKWQRAFSVYDEWQQSSWSRETVLPYYSKKVQVTCQMCHMEREQLPKGDYGGGNGMLASHRWLGSNTAIPTYYHYQDQMEKTAEFLRRNRLKIDIFALHKIEGDSSHLIAPIDKSTFTLLRGETALFDVVIQNSGIGHGLVPEQRDFYECWVQFTATDSAGHTLFSSGYLNPDGSLDKEAHSYTNRLISQAGEELDHHEVWTTKVKAFDRTLLPGRSEAVHYELQIPQDATGPITITASVNYRKFRKSYTDWVLNQDTQYPIVQLATRSLQLKLGLNEAVEAPSKYEDLLR